MGTAVGPWIQTRPPWAAAWAKDIDMALGGSTGRAYPVVVQAAALDTGQPLSTVYSPLSSSILPMPPG